MIIIMTVIKMIIFIIIVFISVLLPSGFEECPRQSEQQEEEGNQTEVRLESEFYCLIFQA